MNSSWTILNMPSSPSKGKAVGQKKGAKGGGVLTNIAFPSLSAASFQSVLRLPSPQVAESCGSFFKSSANTFQDPRYLQQSLILASRLAADDIRRRRRHQASILMHALHNYERDAAPVCQNCRPPFQ
jgi:hypothetical protein